jgi:hypothetical protein
MNGPGELDFRDLEVFRSVQNDVAGNAVLASFHPETLGLGIES